MVFPMLRLKQLKIKNCRGIRDGPNLNFEIGGMLLCGDNGTGKSSYIDAIEKILTEKCSTLDSGTQGLSWKKQGTHIKAEGTPEIELILTDGTADYVISDKQNRAKYPKNIQAFLECARVYPFILHRKTLLDFVDAKPGDRYKAIEGFLQLDEFKGFEEDLKELGRDCESKYNETNIQKDEHIRALRLRLNLPSDSPIDVKTCIAQMNLKLFELGISPLKTIVDIPDRLKKIDESMGPLKHDENLQRWTASRRILDELQKNEIIDSAGKIYSDVRTQLLKKQSTIKGHFYSEILEQGLRWIKEDNLNRCPLCNNEIDPMEVAGYVEKRIKENEEIIRLIKDQDQKYRTFISFVSSNKNILERFRTSLPEMLETELSNKLESLITSYSTLLETHSELQLPEKIIVDLAELQKSNPDSIIQELITKITLICSEFTGHERYGNLFTVKTSLEALDTHQKNIVICDTKLAHYENSLVQIKILMKHAEDSRKTTVQNLMNTIAGLADSYFQVIHPGETIGKPQLEITERGTGSIKLTSNFHGKEDDPRGHYSEGHIDTLGLCLFLAICHAQHKQYPDFTLLILDDVMHSVDGEHRRRTAEMIFREFGDYQIIITTHDRMWFEILKAVSRSNGNAKKFKEYYIAGWSIEEGPILGDHLSDYEWLISSNGIKAQPADRVIKAGRLLEQILQNLCDSLLISVPFRLRGDYTIDPLWNSFYSKVKKQKEFYGKAKTCLDAIEKLRQQRNWVGAHWNAWALSLTAEESKEFAQSVIDLRSFVFCERCNQYIIRIPQLDDQWSCKREHLKYKRS